MNNVPSGHTLVELLIVVSLMLIGVMIAFPVYQGMANQHARSQNTIAMLGLIHYMRHTALSAKHTVTLCPAINNRCISSHVWAGELLMFKDLNKNGQLDTEDILYNRHRLHPKLSWRWWNFRKRMYLQFNPNGQPNAMNGTFTLCQNGLETQKIVINVLGRPRKETMTGRDFFPQ